MRRRFLIPVLNRLALAVVLLAGVPQWAAGAEFVSDEEALLISQLAAPPKSKFWPIFDLLDPGLSDLSADPGKTLNARIKKNYARLKEVINKVANGTLKVRVLAGSKQDLRSAVANPVEQHRVQDGCYLIESILLAPETPGSDVVRLAEPTIFWLGATPSGQVTESRFVMWLEETSLAQGRTVLRIPLKPKEIDEFFRFGVDVVVSRPAGASPALAKTILSGHDDVAANWAKLLDMARTIKNACLNFARADNDSILAANAGACQTEGPL